MFGRKAAEIAELKTRIAILEERLCPFGQHDWEITRRSCYVYDVDSVSRRVVCTCKRCGKTQEANVEED